MSHIHVMIIIKLLYAVAGIFTITGAIHVYIRMNDEDCKDIQKRILIVSAIPVVFIAIAQVLEYLIS